MSVQKKAQDFFKSNPQHSKVFATSDEFLFLQKTHASNHAKTLEDKAVTIIEREPKAKDIEVEAETVTSTKTEPAKTEPAKNKKQ